MIDKKLLNQIIGDEPNLNIAVTSKDLKKTLSFNQRRNVELIDDDLNLKRYYHFVVVDKKTPIKPLFRALRNGGYLISFVDFDENELYDIGFSALNRIDGMLVVKKVHSWNDW